MSWFVDREIEPGVFLIGEPPHVNSFLVVGRDRAALIDTGLGICSIRQAAEQLTDRPLIVVNTHAHFDHIGSNHEFSDIRIHELGRATLARGVPQGLLDNYVEYAAELEAALPAYLAADQRFFFGLSARDRPRSLSQRVRRQPWRIGPSHATSVLREGDRIDLGGRALTVVHTPGHSPDHVALLDEADGILFAGDAVSTGPIYAQWPESDVHDFAATAARLSALRGSVRVVYVHHFLRYRAEPDLLRAVAAGFDALLHGTAEFATNRDCAGQDVSEAVFADFSIYLPANQEVGMPEERIHA